MSGNIAMTLCALVIACVASLGQAEDFLGVEAARARAQEMQQQFFNQMTASLGHGSAGSVSRLDRMQSDMKTLYSALPKNADDSLDPGTARYALHRYFVHKHGWYIRGLETTGDEKWSDAASTTAFEDSIPTYIFDLFTQHSGGQTRLRELAVLAATLEDVVHSEAVQLLSTVFTARGHRIDEKVTFSVEQGILQTYLLFKLIPNPMYIELDTAGINKILRRVPDFYSGWHNTVTWARDLGHTIELDSSRRNPFTGYVPLARRKTDFNTIARVVEKMGETYGKYQNLECRALKNALLDLSDGSGRVHLAKFYRATYEGQKSQFNESPEYLRHLGVLDETDPQQPSVIATNYIYGRANCMASSGLYTICCIDDCESLFAHLEKEIANPLAGAQVVADVVSALSSETVAAPRNLSMVMRRRLDDIAQRHGGSIPIHGRLFAQWMHHAFPNECRYPHVSGSLESPMTPREWFHARGDRRFLKASKEQIQAIIDQASLPSDPDSPDATQMEMALPWTDEEELAVGSPDNRSSARSTFRSISQIVGVLSLVFGLVKMARDAFVSEDNDKLRSSPAAPEKSKIVERHWV